MEKVTGALSNLSSYYSSPITTIQHLRNPGLEEYALFALPFFRFSLSIYPPFHTNLTNSSSSPTINITNFPHSFIKQVLFPFPFSRIFLIIISLFDRVSFSVWFQFLLSVPINFFALLLFVFDEKCDYDSGGRE